MLGIFAIKERGQCDFLCCEISQTLFPKENLGIKYIKKEVESEKKDFERHLAVKILSNIPKSKKNKSNFKSFLKKKVNNFDKKLGFSKQAFSYLKRKHDVIWKNDLRSSKKDIRNKSFKMERDFREIGY